MQRKPIASARRLASQSYLKIDKIVEAAMRCGADAIHPGYGFLAENPKFTAACEVAGIKFTRSVQQSHGPYGRQSGGAGCHDQSGVPVVPGDRWMW